MYNKVHDIVQSCTCSGTLPVFLQVCRSTTSMEYEKAVDLLVHRTVHRHCTSRYCISYTRVNDTGRVGNTAAHCLSMLSK